MFERIGGGVAGGLTRIGKGVGSGLSWVGDTFTKVSQTLSLVSPFLRNVTWQIKRDFINLAKEAYGQNSIVYACLRLLSQSAAEPPLLAYRINEKHEKEPLDFNHPLMKLIRRPNDLQTESQFWEMTALHAALTGRAFWWKQRGRLGQVIALWPLRPDRVAPIYAGSDSGGMPNAIGAAMIISGWAYWPPGGQEPIPIPVEDIFDVLYPDPAGETGGILEGIGAIQVLSREVESDNEATNYVTALLQNSATPGIILRMKQSGVTPAQARDVKRNFRSQFGGANRGTPGVIDAETDITQLGFNLSQLEFPTLRNVAESRIAAALGVPAILVGLQVGLMSGIRATIAEQREYFAETTLSTIWRRFSDQFTIDVAAEFGDDIVCQFDMTAVKALSAQQHQATQAIEDGFKLGAVRVDEYRERVLHLPPIGGEFGESVYVPTAAQPTPADETALAQPQDGGDSAINQAVQRVVVRQPHLLASPKSAKAIDVTPPDLDGYSDELREAVAELFDGVADTIARKIRAREFIAESDLTAAFALVVGPQLTRILTAEGLRLGQSVGIEFDPAVVESEAAAFTDTYVPTLIRGLSETTAPLVQRALAAYQTTPGMTIGELKDLLTGAYGPVRAQMIAVTEVTNMAAHATLQYQSRVAGAGIEMERVWHASGGDDRQCVICTKLDGKAESEWGETYPNGPAAHVNCRCFCTLRVKRQSMAKYLERVAA